MSKTNELKELQKLVSIKINETNMRIVELGRHNKRINATLEKLEKQFERIGKAPDDYVKEYNETKIIRSHYQSTVSKVQEDTKANAKKVGLGAVGATAGTAIATLGPTAAMGIAATFGLASTGTAISTLSGAAMTNAALAWLGGGAIAAGGSGMAAGSALLALAGPIGWAIAGVSIVSSIVFFFIGRKYTKRFKEICIDICKRDEKRYDLAAKEIDERIEKIIDENIQLSLSSEHIELFGTNYDAMTEQQQFELGSCYNMHASATQLLINPIIGIQPMITLKDFELFYSNNKEEKYINICEKYKDSIIDFANFLYGIELLDGDNVVVYKNFKRNKKLLKEKNIKKKELQKIIDASVMLLDSKKNC